MKALNDPITLEKIPLTQEAEISEFIQEFEMNIQRGRFTKYSITLQKKINENPALKEFIKIGLPEFIKQYKLGKLLGNAFEESISPEKYDYTLNLKPFDKYAKYRKEIETYGKSIKFSVTNLKTIKNELNSYDLKNRKIVKPEYNVQHIEYEFGFK